MPLLINLSDSPWAQFIGEYSDDENDVNDFQLKKLIHNKNNVAYFIFILYFFNQIITCIIMYRYNHLIIEVYVIIVK